MACCRSPAPERFPLQIHLDLVADPGVRHRAVRMPRAAKDLLRVQHCVEASLFSGPDAVVDRALEFGRRRGMLATLEAVDQPAEEKKWSASCAVTEGGSSIATCPASGRSRPS